ncbi:MAG: GNAT family N-acetyltransferase [Fimbriimonadaceae bacterium]|nr:MAG: Acetyltransferase (GNAT) family protein [Armatimonadetes bacterium OLB18]WKZ80717.1 MAG: GNAT family N-acetyltransferase [Fimbriimonadaceae bacterium]
MLIEPLSKSTEEGAIRVLASSFHEYPFLSRVFADAELPRHEMLHELFSVSVGFRVACGQPGFVAIEQGVVIGAATVVLPEAEGFPPELEQRWKAMEAKMSANGRTLFEAYDQVQDETRPKEPHLYVAAIGVSADAQGRGVGKSLLSRVHELSASLPGVRGVALDTHDEANVPKYLKLGFELIAERDLLGMPNWYFWNQGSAGE